MRHARRRAITLATTGFAMLAALTACTGTSSYSSANPYPQDMAGEQAAAAKQAPGLYVVRPFDLGPVVVDEHGMMLYRYDRDTANPPKSACNGTCAQLWQPVRPNEKQQLGGGIDKALIGTLTRDDDTDQVTLAGWPLYRYSKDQLPGETAGQGMGGAWYPINPVGQKVPAATDPGQSNAFGN